MILKNASSNISVNVTLSIQLTYTGVKVPTLQSTFSTDVQRTSIVTINMEELGITWGAGETYSIRFNEGAFVDKDLESFTSQAQTLSFTENSAGPTVNTLVPVFETTNYNSPIVQLVFSRKVRAGTGNIKLYNATDTLITTISATDTTKVSFRTGTCVINLRGSLSASTTYYITIDAGAITDWDGLPILAIPSGIIKFTTGNTTILDNIRGDKTYPRNGSITLDNGPLITDSGYSGTDNYTMVISPIVPNKPLIIDPINWDNEQPVSLITSGGLPYYILDSDLGGGPTAFADDGSVYNSGDSIVDTSGISTGTTLTTGSGIDGQVAISSNGSTVAYTDPVGNTCYIIVRSPSGVWSLQTSISNTKFQGKFLSGDGNTLILTNYNHDTGVSDAIKFYKRTGTTWNLEGTIVMPTTPARAGSWGSIVSTSYSGNIVLVNDDGTGTRNNVYVFQRTGTTCAQQSIISGTSAGSFFGRFMVVMPSEQRLYISTPQSITQIYDWNGSSWALSSTYDDATVMINDEENFRVNYAGVGYRKSSITGVWIKGNPNLDNLISPTITACRDCSRIAGGVPGGRAVFSLGTTGTSWDNPTKQLTLTATKDQMNLLIDELTLDMNEYIFDFQIKYEVTTPSATTDNKYQVIKFAP
jgi:hypothetical protein